jgi:TonB family protein
MRLGEEGSAALHVCVGPNGKTSEEPTVIKTSGSSRLDEGAVRLAKAGHYNPGTEDGKPINACFNVSIKFQLKN